MRELKAQAEVNEFLYYKLRESGLSLKMIEDIGIEFLNLDHLDEPHSDELYSSRKSSEI